MASIRWNIQADAAYRRDLVRVVTRRALERAAAVSRRRNRRATWVGRALRRLEDPALVTGRGRCTADVKAQRHVHFVRSAVASGTHRPHRAAGRRHPHHGGRSRRRQADLAHAAQVQLRPIDQPILAAASCGSSANRSPP